MPKGIFLIFIILALAFPATVSGLQDMNTGNDTVIKGITQDEAILFNMINDIRMQNKLPRIPLSPDLCIVAHTHILDLIVSKPQEHGCSLHSWSGSGKWTACCNSKDLSGMQCMKSKPKEITGYAGNGYELIYWGDDNATPADAAALWKQVDASSDMILSRGKWKNYQWKALGVGISGGYAVLWLGDKDDKTAKSKPGVSKPVVLQQAIKKDVTPAKPPVKESKKSIAETPGNENKTTAGNTKPNPAADENSTKYYLIVASAKTAETAKSELKRIKSKGYPGAYVLEGESVYRIAIASFDTPGDAAIKQKQLKDSFPGIWVFKK